MNQLTHDQIVEITGDIDEIKAAEIIATGASLREIEEATVWAKGINRLAHELHRPLTGRVAAVYDILTSSEAYEDEEHS